MSEAGECRVEVSGLKKSFVDEGRGLVEAVKGVDFRCYAGEIFGLLGSNGAGKTTTLRMLSTVISPSAGSASVMGHNVVDGAAEVRRQLGFFSASTSLYPRLSARETLRFFAEVNGVREGVDEAVEKLIKRFSITEFADARVENLSSGMKQKVSIARCLIHDPPILIFDEPTVGLDIINAIEMLEIIGSLRDEGKTVIFSTHIMSEVEKLCDRIAIMQSGRIIACGTLDEHRERTGAHYLEDVFVHYVRGQHQSSANGNSGEQASA